MQPRPLSIRQLFAAAAFALMAASPAAAAQDMDVKVQIEGEEIRAAVSFLVKAPLQHVWEVVTDFERAPEFHRDLQVSRILQRSGDTLRVFQRAQVRYGPFAIPVETTREVKLVPPLRAESRLIKGSMKKYDTVTELAPEGGGTRITYRSHAASAIAASAGEAVIRRETEERFRQLKAEILRREHLAAGQ